MLNRELQKELLEILRSEFPDPFISPCEIFGEDLEKEAEFNLHYLQEHGLVRLELSNSKQVGTLTYPIFCASITGKGIDFLENDGGLTAILGVVTIKFHQDTLSELETMIQLDKTLPEAEKVTLLQKLRSLPEEGAKTLVQELVKAGLQKAPDGWNTAIHYLNNIPWGQTPAT